MAKEIMVPSIIASSFVKDIGGQMAKESSHTQ